MTIDPVRREAFQALSAYYADVFSSGRNEYAIQKGALSDPEKLREMALSSGGHPGRPDRTGRARDVTYTQNWPHESLVGNEPTERRLVWSVISFVLLLAGVGGMVWYFASQERTVETELIPEHDPLLGLSRRLPSAPP